MIVIIIYKKVISFVVINYEVQYRAINPKTNRINLINHWTNNIIG